jgi:hypothetical protein
MISLIKNIDKILISSIVLLLILIAYFSTPYTDDFCMNYIRHLDKNILAIIKERYIVKEGRFVSIPGIFQIAGFKYLSFNFMSMIWVVFFIAISFLLSRIFYNVNVIDKNGRLLIMLVLLLIGSEGVMNDVVFWATGGSYYSVATFLMVLAILVMQKYDKKYLLFFSPLLITIGPNYSLPILFIFLMELFHANNVTSKRKLFFSLFSVLIFSIGIFILMSSPGTQNRLSSVSTFWMWHPRYIIEVVLKIIYTAYSFYLVAFVLTLLSVIKTTIDFYKDKDSFFVKCVKVFFELRFLIAAIGSVLVFVKTPGLFSERAGYSFFILVLIQFIYTFRNFQISTTLTNFYKTIAVLIVLVLSYTLNHVISFNNNYNVDLKKYKQSYNSIFEEKYLYNTVSLPFKRFDKVAKKENIWIGDCFENYYKKNISK